MKRKVSKRRVLRRLPQTGRATGAFDAVLYALAPGKRRSASGHIYYETRRNRSDVSRKRRR